MSLPSWVSEKIDRLERSLKEKSSNEDTLKSLNRFAECLQEARIIDIKYGDNPSNNRWDNPWLDTGIPYDGDDGANRLWIRRAR